MASTKPTSVSKMKATRPYVRVLIADDFRPEQSGKVTGVGLYADGVVVMQIPPDAPAPTKELPYGMSSLAVMMTFGGVAGTFPVRFSFDGHPGLEQEISIAEGGSANVIIAMRPFVIHTLGKKAFTIEFAGEEFTHEIEVRTQIVEGIAPMSLERTHPASTAKAPRRRSTSK